MKHPKAITDHNNKVKQMMLKGTDTLSLLRNKGKVVPKKQKQAK